MPTVKQWWNWFRSLSGRLRRCGSWALAAAVLGAVPALCLGAVARPYPISSPNPALAKFNHAITFYLSFDHLPLIADMSRGNGQPAVAEGAVVLKSGLCGHALLTPESPVNWDAVSYQARHNVNLSRPGALAVWISAYHWRRSKKQVPYLFFLTVRDHGRVLTLARMGTPGNREIVYAYAGLEGKVDCAEQGNSLRWKTGQWHLLVTNWRSESLQFSLDGQPPVQVNLAATGFPNAHGPPGHLDIHPLAPKQRCLLDELLVFNRPLAPKEIRWLYQHGPRRPNR